MKVKIQVLVLNGVFLFLAVGCNQGGVGGTDETPAEENRVETTPVAFNVEGAPTVEFSVPEMMCEESCVPTVREILAEQPGVKDVEVSLAEKRATVAVDESQFDSEKAVAALADRQFKTAKVVDAETATN